MSGENGYLFLCICTVDYFMGVGEHVNSLGDLRSPA